MFFHRTPRSLTAFLPPNLLPHCLVTVDLRDSLRSLRGPSRPDGTGNVYVACADLPKPHHSTASQSPQGAAAQLAGLPCLPRTQPLRPPARRWPSAGDEVTAGSAWSAGSAGGGARFPCAFPNGPLQWRRRNPPTESTGGVTASHESRAPQPTSSNIFTSQASFSSFG